MDMSHTKILNTALDTLTERGDQYGPAGACFDRISKLASIALNKPISRYDVAMILHCVKLGRLQDNRAGLDNYVDGINYLAFAGEFIRTSESVIIAAENDIVADLRGNSVSENIDTAKVGKGDKEKIGDMVEISLPKVALMAEGKVNII